MLADINRTLNKENYPNFTSRIPKGIFFSPRDIPNLRCSRCGHIMITEGEKRKISHQCKPWTIGEILGQVSKYTARRLPYGENFVKGLLETRGIDGVKRLIFHERNEQFMEGKTSRVKDQTREVLSGIKYFIKYDKKVKKYSLPEIMKNLNKIKSELPAENKELVDILTAYTTNFPEMTLKEIVRDEGLYNYHNTLSIQENINHELSNEQIKLNLFKTLVDLPKDTIEYFMELTDKAISISNDKHMSDELRRYFINETYSEIVNIMPDGDMKKQVLKQINDIDLAHYTSNNLFCRLHNKKYLNDETIIDIIVNPLKNTFDHSIPRAMGGKNDIENGTYMCARCNHDCGDLPKHIIAKVFPEYPKNVQKQVSRLTTFIKKGALVGYEQYPQGIKETMKDITGADINIDRYLKDEKKIIEARLQEKRQQLKAKFSQALKAEEEKDHLSEQPNETRLRRKYRKKLRKSVYEFDRCKRDIDELMKSIASDELLLKSIETDLSKKN